MSDLKTDTKTSASEQSTSDLKVVDRRWWARDEQDAGNADIPSLKPTYVEELERQLAEKDTLLQNTVSRYRQAASEFEDAKARLRREIGKDIERARRDVLVEMLDIVDNLDRAIEAARGATTVETLLHGIEMVRSQFMAKLDTFGIKRVESLGELFDASRHEAVTVAPVDDRARDGIIVGVIKHGYMIGDQVLRPAVVAVASCKPHT